MNASPAASTPIEGLGTPVALVGFSVRPAGAIHAEACAVAGASSASTRTSARKSGFGEPRWTVRVRANLGVLEASIGLFGPCQDPNSGDERHKPAARRALSCAA